MMESLKTWEDVRHFLKVWAAVLGLFSGALVTAAAIVGILSAIIWVFGVWAALIPPFFVLTGWIAFGIHADFYQRMKRSDDQ